MLCQNKKAIWSLFNWAPTFALVVFRQFLAKDLKSFGYTMNFCRQSVSLLGYMCQISPLSPVYVVYTLSFTLSGDGGGHKKEERAWNEHVYEMCSIKQILWIHCKCADINSSGASDTLRFNGTTRGSNGVRTISFTALHNRSLHSHVLIFTHSYCLE